MLCACLGDPRSVVANDDTLEAAERIDDQIDVGGRSIGIKRVPDKLGNRLDEVTGARNLLKVIIFCFESENNHAASAKLAEKDSDTPDVRRQSLSRRPSSRPRGRSIAVIVLV